MTLVMMIYICKNMVKKLLKKVKCLLMERKILPLTDDGQLIKSSNFMENRSAENLRSPDNLKPIEKKETGGNANVNTVSQVSNVSNQSFSTPGLGPPHNKDFQKFVMDFA